MATLDQIEQALRAADAAGNTEDARRLAQAYADMRRQQSGSAPADFSGVSALVDSTAGSAPLEIDIVGGTREGAVPDATQPNPANSSDFARMISGQPAPGGNVRQSLFRNDSDFPERSGVSLGTRFGAVARDMFGGRDSAANYLAEKTGGQVLHDASGDPLLRLQDGTTYRLNDPGLDVTDLANVSGNVAAAFLPAAGAARLAQARNIGLAGRVGLQAATAGGTDAALQAAVDQGNIDPTRVATSALGGGGGELVGTGLSALAGRFLPAWRSATGKNTDAAGELLNLSGVPADPASVSKLAPMMEQVYAGADPNALVGQNQFGFQYTLGQRLLDPEKKFAQLSREELLRQSPSGGEEFRTVQRANEERLGTALTGMSEGLGARSAATPAEMVQGATTGLRAQADALQAKITDAYAKAGEGARMAIGADAVAALPGQMRQAVSGFDIHPQVTPVAARTLEQMREATNSILGGIDGSNVKGVTLKALETQRRILNNNINAAAANPADRAAVTAMKRQFDSWMDDAVDTALVSGDPASLQALKEARGLRAEFGRRFEGKGDSDKFIAGLLDGSRTPEELINVALGASQVSKAGGARFIDRLAKAADNDPEIIGSLRAAHFARLTRGANGDPLQMGQIVRNIRSTEYSNASVVKALYSPEQWNRIRLLASSLEPMLAKGDFAKSSGTAERLFRAMGGSVGDIPLIGGVLKATQGVRSSMQAGRAINAPVRRPATASPLAPAAISASADEGAR